MWYCGTEGDRAREEITELELGRKKSCFSEFYFHEFRDFFVDWGNRCFRRRLFERIKALSSFWSETTFRYRRQRLWYLAVANQARIQSASDYREQVFERTLSFSTEKSFPTQIFLRSTFLPLILLLSRSWELCEVEKQERGWALVSVESGFQCHSLE